MRKKQLSSYTFPDGKRKLYFSIILRRNILFHSAIFVLPTIEPATSTVSLFAILKYPISVLAILLSVSYTTFVPHTAISDLFFVIALYIFSHISGCIQSSGSHHIMYGAVAAFNPTFRVSAMPMLCGLLITFIRVSFLANWLTICILLSVPQSSTQIISMSRIV